MKPSAADRMRWEGLASPRSLTIRPILRRRGSRNRRRTNPISTPRTQLASPIPTRIYIQNNHSASRAERTQIGVIRRRTGVIANPYRPRRRSPLVRSELGSLREPNDSGSIREVELQPRRDGRTGGASRPSPLSPGGATGIPSALDFPSLLRGSQGLTPPAMNRRPFGAFRIASHSGRGPIPNGLGRRAMPAPRKPSARKEVGRPPDSSGTSTMENPLQHPMSSRRVSFNGDAPNSRRSSWPAPRRLTRGRALNNNDGRLPASSQRMLDMIRAPTKTTAALG